MNGNGGLKSGAKARIRPFAPVLRHAMMGSRSPAGTTMNSSSHRHQRHDVAGNAPPQGLLDILLAVALLPAILAWWAGEQLVERLGERLAVAAPRP
jgi:hypothetical protein